VLSEERALSVAQFLEAFGIEGSRLETIGYGLSRPIATNDTEEGRALNRRTEIEIIE
jgi:outer membrane protein OmpA-like peptidoglycan-associated protein